MDRMVSEFIRKHKLKNKKAGIKMTARDMKQIQVENARYVDGFKVEIEFNYHSIKTIDFGDFLAKHPHPQHDKYKNIELFKQFKIESGNLVWGENWDLIFQINQLYRGTIK